MLTLAVALDEGPLDAVAVTVQEPAAAGAVNRPEDEIVPQELVQLTGALAVNCCVFNACRLTLAGVTVSPAITATEAIAGLPPAVGVAVTLQDSGTSGAV